jgi:hypothetical protein
MSPSWNGSGLSLVGMPDIPPFPVQFNGRTFDTYFYQPEHVSSALLSTARVTAGYPLLAIVRSLVLWMLFVAVVLATRTASAGCC